MEFMRKKEDNSNEFLQYLRCGDECGACDVARVGGCMPRLEHCISSSCKLSRFWLDDL